MKLALSRSIFWDVDYDSMDEHKHASFIIERVLGTGTLEDFNTIKDFYGRNELKKVVKKIRYLDERVMHFCSVYFDIPLNSL